MKTLYEQAVELMDKDEISHHESDLYLKVTPVSLPLIDKYEFGSKVTRFISQIDGGLWFEIPFAHDPYWERLIGNTI